MRRLEIPSELIPQLFTIETNLQFELEAVALDENLQAIGKAFGLVIFGCTIPGKLEASIERLREQNQNDGPFAVLQSRSLRNQIE